MQQHLEQQKPFSLSLFCIICDRERGKRIMAELENKRSFFTLVTLGKGTANSRVLNYLGLGQSEKTVFFSIMPAEIAKAALEKLDAELDFEKPGHGVGFVARVQEGCYHIPVRFTGEQTEEQTMQNSTHDLILVILNRGYTEEVMDVARKAGASGGTVLHARGCGLAGAEKFFGITIQPEKELVMIAAENDVSCGIMGAIADEAGPGTDANAVSFSLPLTAVKGLGRDVPADVAK